MKHLALLFLILLNIVPCVAQETIETPIRTFEGSGPVAFSPDGDKVFAGGKLWDIASQMVQSFTHSGSVLSVAFSPDGTKVLIGYDDGSTLWDIASGEEVRHFGSRKVDAVAFSPDGTKILTAEAYGPVMLWDNVTGQVMLDIPYRGNFGDPQQVTFSLDGTKFLIGGRNIVGVWDIVSGQIVHTIKTGTETATKAFSRGGSKVLARMTAPALGVWDISTGELIQAFIVDREGADVLATAGAFSPDGLYVVIGGWGDGLARLYDIASGELLRIFHHGDQIDSLAFSPDGTKILTGGGNNAKLWDVGNINIGSTEFETLNGFHAEFLHTVPNLMQPGNTIVPGTNDDAIVIEISDFGEESLLVWYGNDTRKEIARSGRRLSIRSIFPWGLDALLVAVRLPDFNTYKIYKLTGPFSPAGIGGFGKY